MPIGSLRKPFTRIAFCSFGIGIKLICASSDPEGVGEFHWKIRNLKFTPDFQPCVHGLTFHMISDIYEINASTHRTVDIYITKL